MNLTLIGKYAIDVVGERDLGVGQYCGPDGMACDDGDLCTVDDICTAGACMGTPLICDDGTYPKELPGM